MATSKQTTSAEHGARRRTRRPGSSRDTIVGRLRAADPFELIRWLARSQPDPRKALAELVQNSLDAGARRIEISRVREHGVLALRILDDGLGVIPELGRQEALTYLATHIGHSRKRNLDPQQRRELMLQGKYGIGLLGFWAIGAELEIRTQLPGEPSHLLRLHEESPHYEIEPFRGRLSFGERYTEVVVRGLHRAASLSLTARRMAEFLAAELRGQLLEREIELVIHDRVARGRAPKVLAVRPTRFDGERLDLPESIEVPRFSTIRVELHLLPPGEPKAHGVSVSCAGTIVYDDIADMEIRDFRRPPWTEQRLTGLLEFGDFQVPPGTRRGVMPDAAALAFVHAVAGFEPQVAALVSAAGERAAAAVEANLLRQLERAFQDVSRLAPEYDFFAVRGLKAARLGASAPGIEGDPDGSGAAAEGAVLPLANAVEDEVDTAPEDDGADLFPPGPIAALEIAPASTRVEPLGRRRLRAVARDAHGRPVADGLSITWTVKEGAGAVAPGEGSRVEFLATQSCGRAVIEAGARQGSISASATAVVEVAEAGEAARAARTGIPEPSFVDLPMAGWRSRMNDGRWEVNSGHPDFRIASESAKRKLRYLTALLAKEVVVHSFPVPSLSPALERLIGVLTITERRLER